MTSRAPAVVPPIVLAVAPATMSTPLVYVEHGRGAGGVRADVVALDHVARRARVGDQDADALSCPR